MHQPRNEDTDSKATRESNQSLWLLVASPAIWAVHFLSCYLTVAIWCAKISERDGPLGTARLAVGIYTAIALVGILIVGWLGLGRYGVSSSPGPYDADTPEDRHRFLGFATVLLSSLSALATIFVSLAAVFIQWCY
jgi:hypothetical protein